MLHRELTPFGNLIPLYSYPSLVIRETLGPPHTLSVTCLEHQVQELVGLENRGLGGSDGEGDTNVSTSSRTCRSSCFPTAFVTASGVCCLDLPSRDDFPLCCKECSGLTASSWLGFTPALRLPLLGEL